MYIARVIIDSPSLHSSYNLQPRHVFPAASRGLRSREYVRHGWWACCSARAPPDQTRRIGGTVRFRAGVGDGPGGRPETTQPRQRARQYAALHPQDHAQEERQRAAPGLCAGRGEAAARRARSASQGQALRQQCSAGQDWFSSWY